MRGLLISKKELKELRERITSKKSTKLVFKTNSGSVGCSCTGPAQSCVWH